MKKNKVYLLLIILLIAGSCRRVPTKPALPAASPTPSPSPSVVPATPLPIVSPTPTPMPTPVTVPSKRMETAKLFSGFEMHATVETEHGSNAAVERVMPSSYELELTVKARVPAPSTELGQLTALNGHLPLMLPGLERLLQTAKPSKYFDDFYGLKVAALNQQLSRLDQLVSRHNFFDCETILEMQDAQSGRRLLFIQADMDIDMDGSDGDRMPLMNGTTANYQPMTSYKWPKKTAVPNPYLAAREEKLKQLEAEFATKGLSIERNKELRDAIQPLRYEVNQLKTMSFLMGATDPFVVLPGSIAGHGNTPFTPHLGDYCVVVYNDSLYPAIVGDVGPYYKMGEASLRLGKELNSKATAYIRPVSELKVTYLVFPGSADKPFDAPDLDKWRTRCCQLLGEIGGFQGDLHAWEDLTKPPFPSPAPSASASPSPSSPPSVAPFPAPSLPAASPIPTISPATSPAVSFLKTTSS